MPPPPPPPPTPPPPPPPRPPVVVVRVVVVALVDAEDIKTKLWKSQKKQAKKIIEKIVLYEDEVKADRTGVQVQKKVTKVDPTKVTAAKVPAIYQMGMHRTNRIRKGGWWGFNNVLALLIGAGAL